MTTRKNLTFVLVLLLCLTSVMSAFAQDEEAPEVAYVACTEEELVTAIEAINEHAALLTDVGDITAAPGEGYGAVLAAYDAFTYEFWYTVAPELPLCAEVQALAINIGMIYDGNLTVGLINNIAARFEAEGATADAEAFTASSTARAEKLAELTLAMSDVSTEALADWANSNTLEACDEETFAASLTTIGDYFTNLAKVAAEMSDGGEDKVGAFITADVASTNFWTTVYPEVNTCYESNAYAWEAGRILDETTIIAALNLNAELEGAAENTEVAETLAASALARQEGLAEYAASVFPPAEETAE